MANLPESPTYDAGVYQLETTDPVQGGPGGVSNAQAQALANRTSYLKNHVDDLESGTTIPAGVAELDSPSFTGLPTAPTQSANTNSTALATTAFVQRAHSGRVSINVSGGSNVTLSGTEAGHAIVRLTGTITADIDVIFPNTGHWNVDNQTSGAFTITCRTAAGGGVTVDQGRSKYIIGGGVNIINAQDDLRDINLTGNPTAPTQAPGDISSRIANTGFVWQATRGQITVDVSGGTDTVLTEAQGANPFISFTGTLTANKSVIVPSNRGPWFLFNQTTGAFDLTVKTAAGSGVVLAPGIRAVVHSGGSVTYSSDHLGGRPPSDYLTVDGGIIQGDLEIASSAAVLTLTELDQPSGSQRSRFLKSGGSLAIQNEGPGRIQLAGFVGSDLPGPPQVRLGGAWLDLLHTGGGQTIDGNLTLTGTISAQGGTLATESYADAAAASAAAAVVDAAPATLDTLNELATALGDDPNFAASTSAALGARLVRDNNLSDLTNASTARTNLGLGSAASVSFNNISTTGNITAGGVFNVASDERKKRDIRPAPTGIMRTLAGVEYSLKANGKHSSGVIAQALLKAGLNHLVSEDEDGMLTVNYDGLWAYAIEDYKDLERRLAEFEAAQSALCDRLEALENFLSFEG